MFTFIQHIVWIINSDIIIHVSDDKKLFQNFQKINSLRVQTANDTILNINDFKNIFIKLLKNRTLTFTQMLYISKIIVNLISVVFLTEKCIEIYFSFNKSAYLNYFDQYIIFANNVHKQYLLKTCKIDIVDFQPAILSMYIWKTWSAINL